MLTFKSLADVDRARLPTRLDRLVRRCVEACIRAGDFPEAGHAYDPEQDGFVALLQRGDDKRPLTELNLDRRMDELAFESLEVDVESRAFVGVFLANNQFALTLILAQAAWLDPAVRQRLSEKLDPPPPRPEEGNRP